MTIIPLGVVASKSGSVPYHASAVHFGGATALHITSLTATDNGLYSVVGWFKLSAAQADINNNLFTSDPTGNYGPSFQLESPLSTGQPFPISFRINNSDNSKFGSTTSTASAIDDTWQCSISTLDASTGSIAGKIYIGDTDVTSTLDATGAPFTIASNGRSLYFGDDSFSNFVQGDYADWRIMPGTSLLTAGDISLATRRLFIDGSGKPVNPAVATAALGAPCILFSGNASAFGTNQGTGGAFTLTGILTNASTSPSD